MGTQIPAALSGARPVKYNEKSHKEQKEENISPEDAFQ